MTGTLLLLGILSALSSVCNVAVIGALAGYAGAKENARKADNLIVAASFMAGTVLSLTVIGAVIGFAGQMAGTGLGRYSRVLTGLLLVFFGLMALDLAPLKIPELDRKALLARLSRGMLGTVLFGFVLGGASITCSLSCASPALIVLLGVAGIQGQWLKSALLLGVFGAGYSLPLAAILLGVSYGRWSLRTSKIIPFIKISAGVLLLGIGFYFLATV
ncbi:hypothetical protein KKF70_00820 [bacterium]|nr:hypothetical protein [bacterium]